MPLSIKDTIWPRNSFHDGDMYTGSISALAHLYKLKLENKQSIISSLYSFGDIKQNVLDNYLVEFDRDLAPYSRVLDAVVANFDVLLSTLVRETLHYGMPLPPSEEDLTNNKIFDISEEVTNTIESCFLSNIGEGYTDAQKQRALVLKFINDAGEGQENYYYNRLLPVAKTLNVNYSPVAFQIPKTITRRHYINVESSVNIDELDAATDFTQYAKAQFPNGMITEKIVSKLVTPYAEEAGTNLLPKGNWGPTLSPLFTNAFGEIDGNGLPSDAVKPQVFPPRKVVFYIPPKEYRTNITTLVVEIKFSLQYAVANCNNGIECVLSTPEQTYYWEAYDLHSSLYYSPPTPEYVEYTRSASADKDVRKPVSGKVYYYAPVGELGVHALLNIFRNSYLNLDAYQSYYNDSNVLYKPLVKDEKYPVPQLRFSRYKSDERLSGLTTGLFFAIKNTSLDAAKNLNISYEADKTIIKLYDEECIIHEDLSNPETSEYTFGMYNIEPTFRFKYVTYCSDDDVLASANHAISKAEYNKINKKYKFR